MSVFLYSGLPGAGKSYGVVEQILIPAAKAGRVICTNIALVSEFASEFRCVVLPVPSEDAGWAEIPAGAVVVIDEAWRFFPAGVQSNKLPEQIREAFAMHRHKVDADGRCQQWILVTQQAAQLSRFVRDLVEQHFRITKLAAVGATRKFRVDVYEGVELEESKRIRQIYGAYSADVWRFYRSHTASESGRSGADEGAIDKRGSVLNSWLVKFGLPAALVMLVFGGFRLAEWFGVSGDAGEAPAEPAATMQPSGGVVGLKGVPAGASPPAVRKESARWRIAAELARTDGSGQLVVLEDASGRHRKVPGKWCIRVEGELTCEVDGEVVTFYSGTPSRSPAALLPSVVKKEG